MPNISRISLNCQTGRLKNCIGNFNKYIQIVRRKITAPDYANDSDVEIDELFDNIVHVWANIKTMKGPEVFDEVAITQDINYKFTTMWLGEVIVNGDFNAGKRRLDKDCWILYNNNRYKIMSVENIDEENKYICMRASLTGSVNKPASKA